MDVVLTDVLMPEVSGFELLINILQQPRFSHIAIILMSSSTTDDMVLRAQEAGAADFLCKPVRREEMFELRRHAKGDRRGREGREGKEESRRTSLPEQPPKEDRAVDDGGVSGQR